MRGRSGWGANGGEGGRKDGGSRFARRVGPLFLLVCLLATGFALAGCGGPPEVTGEWRGRMVFEEAAGDTSADLELSLTQDEGGAVDGTGTLTTRTPGNVEEVELSEVAGEVDEDGGIALEARGGGLSASSALRLEGEAGGDSIAGAARMGSRTLASDLEGMFSGEEARELSGTFELERRE